MTQAAGVGGTARIPGCHAGRLGWASRAGQSSWAQVGRGGFREGVCSGRRSAGSGGWVPRGPGEMWGSRGLASRTGGQLVAHT